MKKYQSFFKIRVFAGLQYRTAAAAGIATQFAWGFMNILLFAAFYRTDPAAFPMGISQLSSYIWLQQAFLTLFMLWGFENEIFSAITGGQIAYELARPLDLYAMWFVKHAAGRVSKVVLRCVPLLVVAALLPAPYGLAPPAGGFAALLFVPTMLFSFLLGTAFCMLIYVATFYTMSPMGVRIMAVSVTELLTGQIVPLPFLPDWLQRGLELTPFASMQNLPLRIYSGHIAGGQAIEGLLWQLFWLAALVLLGRLWMRRALRRVVVQGG